MAPVLVIFDDHHLALRCREGAIHPISFASRAVSSAGWGGSARLLGWQPWLGSEGVRPRFQTVAGSADFRLSTANGVAVVGDRVLQ